MAEIKKKSSKPASSRTASEKPKARPAKPASTSKDAPSKGSGAAAGDATEQAVADQVLTISQQNESKGAKGVVLYLLCAAVLGLAVYASWPAWSPYVSARFPALEYTPTPDPQVAGFAGRLDALEAKTSTATIHSAIIPDMEQERQRLQQEVGQLLERLGLIEQTIDDVRQMVIATGIKEPVEETRRALEQITARLAELEKSDGQLGALTERIDQLVSETAKGTGKAQMRAAQSSEEIKTMIGQFEERIDSLEESGAATATSQSKASAIILAVSQLRKSAVSGKPFDTDTEALRVLVQNHPDMLAALSILEKNAKTGSATIDDLRNRFSSRAADIVDAGNGGAASGWFEAAKKRVFGLVSIRKTDVGDDPVSVSSLVSRAEAYLRQGDITAAVAVIEKLKSVSEPAAQAAEPWLKAAKGRLLSERAVTSLHVYAVALVAADKK